MQRYLIAVFNEREDAETAVRDLQEAGIPAEEISVAAGRHHHRTLIERLGMADTPILTGSNAEGQEDHMLTTETGMKTGAEIGVVVGLLAGIALVAATGGGLALLVGGPLAAAIGGGITGVAAGGLTGALIGMGLPRDTAEAVQERLKGGAIVVSLRVEEIFLDRVERIFNRHNLDEVIITGLGGAVA